MVILTAFAIGLLAVVTRSVLSCALAGVLIVAAFGLAALAGPGSVALTSLLAALLSYNAGIAGPVCLVFALGHRRTV